MEFFLWFWLLDRRFFCEMRPLLKHFSFFWLFPISVHIIMATFNIANLFPFENLSVSQYIVVCITIFEIASIISIFLMMINLYKIAKRQPKIDKNIIILFFEKIETRKKENKDKFIYYEDYWMARKNLLSINGIIILLLSIIHIVWSYYYLKNIELYQDLYKWGKNIPTFYCYINILFCIPTVSIFTIGIIIKASFIFSAILCSNCVLYLSEIFCKKNKGLKKTIDFSNIQRLEPEYI